MAGSAAGSQSRWWAVMFSQRLRHDAGVCLILRPLGKGQDEEF
jgi:hypothetical protein